MANLLRRIELRHVHFMPKELEPGMLYVTEEFGTAAHLCACGCGEKVRTPLGPTGWTLKETSRGPSLWPSVGNWQKGCCSHYIIERGDIIWAGRWTPERVARGRQAQQERDRAFYEALDRKRHNLWSRLWRWLRSIWAALRHAGNRDN